MGHSSCMASQPSISCAKTNLNGMRGFLKNIERQWVKWVHRLQRLVYINIPRCYKPLKLGDIKDCSIHHFSDVSEKEYGQSSYLRLVDRSHCTLLIGKSRVAPIKYESVPRLELTAATLSLKTSNMLQKDLDAEQACNMTEYYWADNAVVLGYINNDAKRFKVFVANTAKTPVDYASRALDIS